MKKRREKKYKLRLFALITLLFFIIGELSVFSADYLSNIAWARTPCGASYSTSEGDDQCDIDNQNTATSRGMDTQQYINTLSACTGSHTITGSGIKIVNTVIVNVGNGACSNAIASCAEHHLVISDCSDANYIAEIATCNNGDVSASGNNGFGSIPCGTENVANFYKNEQGLGKITLNSDYNQQQVDNYAKAECTVGNGYDNKAKQDACKQTIKSQMDDCWNSVGGVDSSKYYDANNGSVTNDVLKQCMVKSADNQAACTARGGSTAVFTPGNNGDATHPSTVGTCTVPPVKNSATDCTDHGGGTADPKTGLCPDGSKPGDASTIQNKGLPTSDGKCGTTNGKAGGTAIKTNIISCGSDNGATAIGDILKIGVFILTAIVGVLAVGGLAWASIQYAQAGDNQGTVSEAKNMIQNIIIGIILYGFLIAIVNFLLPGGLIK